MSTTDPRLSRYGQYYQAQQSQQPQGLLALSISHTYSNGNHQNGHTNGHATNENGHLHHPQEAFHFDSESENEIDRPRYDYEEEEEDDDDEIGRRHAAPSKRKIIKTKQQKTTQQQPGHSSGVFLETDIDSGEVQVRPMGDPVRGARSVGDLVQTSPGRGEMGGKDGVSPSDRDKSKSVNFGRGDEENSLMKQPSVHDMRVDKSLERINVPEWYRQNGDDDDDSRVFRLRSVHDDDGYWDDDSRQARNSVFIRTKSAPPSRKPSTSNSTAISALEAVRQSRQWTLSRAVGNESRASTTASVASNFRRPSVRYAEKDASLRRPKPIPIRTLDAVVNAAQSLPPRPGETEGKMTQRTVTEVEVKTSQFSYTKTVEDVTTKRPGSSPPPMKQPLHVDTRYVDGPTFHKAEQRVKKESPMQVPIQAQRLASPPGPPTMPKPGRGMSPSPVQPIPVTFRQSASPQPPKTNGSLIVMEEQYRRPSPPQPVVVSPQLIETDLTRRPVLLAGYNEAEFIDTGVEESPVAHPPPPLIESPKQQLPVTTTPTSVKTPSPTHFPTSSTGPTPFVLHNKPVVQPFHQHQNGYSTVPTRSSRVTDIDDVPPVVVSITPPAQVDVVTVSPPSRFPISSLSASPPPPLQTAKPLSPPVVPQQPLAINISEQRVLSPPVQPQQPSPVSWHTTTVLQTQTGAEEIVIDTDVQVSTRRTGQTPTPPDRLPSPVVVQSVVSIETGEEAAVQLPPPPSAVNQPLNRASAASSLRASFKKPGKFLAKLWKDNKETQQKQPISIPVEFATKHEEEEDVAQMPPPPPPIPTPPQDQPQSTVISSPSPPNDEVVVVPSTSTEKLSAKNGPARSSFRALFFRDKSRDSSKEKKSTPSSSKSCQVIAEHQEIKPSSSSPAPVIVDLNQTSINESMTISEVMSASVVSEPPTKSVISTTTAPPPQKKPSLFSPAKWISSRSPAKKTPPPEKPSPEKTPTINGTPTNGSSHKENEAVKEPEPSENINANRNRSGSWLVRGDVDASVGYKPIKLPEEVAPPPPPQPTHSAISSKHQYQSQSSIGNVSGDGGRDLDAISTTSSQKKRTRNIFQAIMQYQEEHDHGGYSRQYVPPPTGETASWLHRRDVPQLVNSTLASSRPSQANTPGLGSPVSGRSMTMPPSRQGVAADLYSLRSQSQQSGRYQPDFSSLSASYHPGVAAAKGGAPPMPEPQPQPPNGPYSRQLSAASSQQLPPSSYQTQMAHQLKIRQQMPPPPQRLNPAAMPPHPQINVPPPSRPIADFSPPVICQRPGCNHTVSAEQARQTFRICDSCGGAFCSRQCRDAHMVGTARKRCPLDNVRDLCQRAAKRLESDRILVALLSQFARMSYLCHGRGYVYAHFSGPERAAAFSNGQMGLHSLALEFHTVTHTEAALVRGEPLEEVMDLLQSYNPESKLVLCVGVSVAGDRPSIRPNRPPNGAPGGSIGSPANHVTSWDTAALEDLTAPNGESRVVLRAAKLRLAVPRAGTLRALLLVSAGVAFQNRRGNLQRMRELTFSNIQMHLKRRGVDLLASHPNVYTRLTQYVAGAMEFPPTGLCIWDDAVGRSLLALLFPEALPRQDWLRTLHQLGDVELGLPDPRQLAMGVDV